MKKGKTSTGFEFELDTDVIMDMEFIELAAEASENGTKYPAMVEYALGKEQKKRLYNHVRNERGRVMFDDIRREFDEIFNIANEKNS